MGCTQVELIDPFGNPSNFRVLDFQNCTTRISSQDNFISWRVIIMWKIKKKQRRSSFTNNYLQIQDLDIHNKKYGFRVRVLIKLSNV